MIWFFVILGILLALLFLLVAALILYYFLKWIIRDAVFEALVKFKEEQEENNNCSK